MNKMKIVKGDEVVVITGKDKGRMGEVLRVFPVARKVLVKGVNVVRRHMRPTQENAGGIVTKELPVDVSNVALVDPKTRKPTRVGIKIEKDGMKKRVAKKSGEFIEKPRGGSPAKAPKAAKGKGRK